MNLFIYETKSGIKTTLIWIITLVFLFFVMMLGAYPAYSSAAVDVKALIESYPPEFIKAFGMELDSLFSYGGFYNFAFAYISFVGAIMASSLGVSVFSKEKRCKCLDFLLTKPVSRAKIFTCKLLSCIGLIVATNVVYIGFSMVFYNMSNEQHKNFSTFFIALLGMFFTQILFLSFGIAVATFSKKVRSVAGVATAFGFGGFILSAICNIFSDKNITFIAPLKYFEPNAIFNNGHYDYMLSGIAALAVAVCIGLSYVRFCKSDAHAV